MPSHLVVTANLLSMICCCFSIRIPWAGTSSLKQAALAIRQGQVVVIDDFIDSELISALRKDAFLLESAGFFRASGLSNSAVSGQTFSTRSDRLLCSLSFDSLFRTGQDDVLLNGDVESRQTLAEKVNFVKSQLAILMERALAAEGLDHEVAYSIYKPRAWLRRHLDESHEELKGSKGWMHQSRRSISWLVYLNSPDWESNKSGGALRIFSMPQHTVGATVDGGPWSVGAHESNLQVGWLQNDELAEPVFLDCWSSQIEASTGSIDGGALGPLSYLYVVRESRRVPVSHAFSAVGARRLRETLLDTALHRFVQVEDQESWGRGFTPMGTEAVDVAPRGGTLVLFDSVTSPHEVTAVGDGEARVAMAGWFHESQQEFPQWVQA